MLKRIKYFCFIWWIKIIGSLRYWHHRRFCTRPPEYFDRMVLRRSNEAEELEIDNFELFKLGTHNFHNLTEALNYFKRKISLVLGEEEIDLFDRTSNADLENIYYKRTEGVSIDELMAAENQEIIYGEEYIHPEHPLNVQFAYEALIHLTQIERNISSNVELSIIAMLDAFYKMEILSGAFGAKELNYEDTIFQYVKTQRQCKSNGGQRDGSPVNEEHERWRQEAESVRKTIFEPDNDSAVARIVIKNLDLKRSLDTVRKVIKP
ncbi:hypothetical protein EP073_01030 [Geovibrio thiophilus]|uniref:Uncharacterized protein n=1 Tax=Geovibrio thiophilus TaxID=139438 RepID=A0A410JV34_9BACT|nr:hypothetical protein [Geovibrio thiophilus]QAR32033.1 hypothetical protein EP073_01030 [Geovibrio thiophilus]